jgi:hypothetical protein
MHCVIQTFIHASITITNIFYNSPIFLSLCRWHNATSASQALSRLPTLPYFWLINFFTVNATKTEYLLVCTIIQWIKFLKILFFLCDTFFSLSFLERWLWFNLVLNLTPNFHSVIIFAIAIVSLSIISDNFVRSEYLLV